MVRTPEFVERRVLNAALDIVERGTGVGFPSDMDGEFGEQLEKYEFAGGDLAADLLAALRRSELLAMAKNYDAGHPHADPMERLLWLYSQIARQWVAVVGVALRRDGSNVIVSHIVDIDTGGGMGRSANPLHPTSMYPAASDYVAAITTFGSLFPAGAMINPILGKTYRVRGAESLALEKGSIFRVLRPFGDVTISDEEPEPLPNPDADLPIFSVAERKAAFDLSVKAKRTA